MKKFFKLVAVVIAIAVIICPMMSVVSHASATGGYKIEALDANNLKLTINSTDGFIAYHATVGFNSNTAFQSSYNADNYKNGLKVISYTLKTAEANDHNAPAISANASGNSLTVIVMPSDINNLDKCTEIVIGIRVADGTTASLTKIQAADDGADVTADPTLLTFPAAGSDGVIDSTAQDYLASNATTNAHSHSFTQQSTESAYLRTPATCTADATYWLSCPTCGLASSTEYFTATGTKIAHTADHTKTYAKDPATCTTDATYYDECSVCHQQLDTFWTENNTALGHNMTHHDSVSSTCLVQGNIEYYSCSTCGKFFADENGATELTAEQTKRALAAHTPATAVKENEVAATCTTAGSYDSVVYCSVCEEEISRETVNVPAKGHTPATAVEENRVEATCGVAGSYDSVVYCSVCHAEISRTQQTIPATGTHTYTYTSNGDGTHTVGCANCDYSAQEACDTEGEDGACSKCGYKATTEAVEDATLVFASVSPSYMATGIQINFRVENTVLAKYDDMEVVIIPQKYDRTTLNKVANPTEIVTKKDQLVAAGTKRKQYTYTDIMLYELGLNVNYMLRAYDANGNLVAYSPVYTTSVETWLRTQISATSDANAKRMYIDTLSVCDETMKGVATNYPNSDLATDYATHRVTADIDLSQGSTSISDCNTVNNFTSNSAEFTQASTAVHQVRTSVSTEKVPYITLRIADQSKVLDLNKLAVTVTYTSRDSQGDHPYEKTFTGSDFSYAGKFIQMKFDEVGLHDSNKDITFSCTYDGVQMFELVYSIETYESSMKDNASIGGLMTALIKLGQSFRTYQKL